SISQSRLIEQNVPGGQRPRQGQTLQRAAPRQSDIGLSVGECSPAEVDVDVVQGQPLSFVNGESPGETNGILLEGAGDGADDFLLRAVVGVAALLPTHGF